MRQTQPTQPEALRLADEWLRKTQSEADRRNSAYDHFGMDNTPEKVDPLGAKMAAELRRLHAYAQKLESQVIVDRMMQGTPATGGEPVAWMDDFGNAFPLAANKGAGSWMDAHKRAWKPLYTSPQPLREPLNTVELMRVVMKADEETRGNALRGTTNWAGHIGKAVQNAVLGIKGGQHGTD